jgi:hypothetical protein
LGRNLLYTAVMDFLIVEDSTRRSGKWMSVCSVSAARGTAGGIARGAVGREQ